MKTKNASSKRRYGIRKSLCVQRCPYKKNLYLLKEAGERLGRAATVAGAYIRSNGGQFFPNEALGRAGMLAELDGALSHIGFIMTKIDKDEENVQLEREIARLQKELDSRKMEADVQRILRPITQPQTVAQHYAGGGATPNSLSPENLVAGTGLSARGKTR